MPRSRPASKPISYHKHTRQYYITRGGKRIYLGTDEDNALDKYHRLNLGVKTIQEEPISRSIITVKELANRFLSAQQANWQNPEVILKCYKDWLRRFMKDHPQLWITDLTVESFAALKLSLKERGYLPESINHYLGAVRAMFTFAEDTGIIEKAPKLKRVKNEGKTRTASSKKSLYTRDEIQRLLNHADVQLKAMIMLALNCGFGPKDMRDLAWNHSDGERVTLPRSKTGISQTYLMWSETRDLLEEVRQQRDERIARALKRGNVRCDSGHVFVTKF